MLKKKKRAKLVRRLLFRLNLHM